MGNIVGGVLATFASIGALVVGVLGLITPVVVALILAGVGLPVGIVALIYAVRADTQSQATRAILERMKSNVASQIDDAEATLKQGS